MAIWDYGQLDHLEGRATGGERALSAATRPCQCSLAVSRQTCVLVTMQQQLKRQLGRLMKKAEQGDATIRLRRYTPESPPSSSDLRAVATGGIAGAAPPRLDPRRCVPAQGRSPRASAARRVDWTTLDGILRLEENMRDDIIETLEKIREFISTSEHG